MTENKYKGTFLFKYAMVWLRGEALIHIYNFSTKTFVCGVDNQLDNARTIVYCSPTGTRNMCPHCYDFAIDNIEPFNSDEIKGLTAHMLNFNLPFHPAMRLSNWRTTKSQLLEMMEKYDNLFEQSGMNDIVEFSEIVKNILDMDVSREE